MQKAPLSFGATHRDFIATLHKRVGQYFQLKGISKQGNAEMHLKTVFMFLIYFIPYVLIVTNLVEGTSALLALTAVMGLGIAGIGFGVMHDANHGAYSSKAWVNQLMGYSLNLMGANAFNWKIQHNVLHHSFTNVHDHDEDIAPRGVLRLCPSTPLRAFHRYQFIYAWFLYAFMTIAWLFVKDFVRIFRYQYAGLVGRQNANIAVECLILIATKIAFIGYMIVVPIAFTSMMWWQVILGVLLMHLVAGFILAIVFQPAHVIEGTAYPLPDKDQRLENSWAVHQLLTTTNFGNKSRWFTWYVGGLNFQIEHHLFPNICHVHYPGIAAIVRSTAHEFGLPYKSFNTFRAALASHARLLRDLGNRRVVNT